MNEEQNQPERISSKYLDAADKYNLTDAELRDYLSYEGIADDEFTAIMQERALRAQGKAKQEQAMVEEKISQIETEIESIEEQPQEEQLRVGIGAEMYANTVKAIGDLELSIMEAFDSLTGYDSSEDTTITELLAPRLKGLAGYSPEQRADMLNREIEDIRSSMATIEGSALENLNPFDDKGDLLDGIHYAFTSVLGSVPTMMLARTGAGAVLVGSSRARSTYHSVRDNKYMSESEKFWYSTIEGGTDAFTDWVGGRIMAGAFKGAAQSPAKKLLSRSFAKALSKRMGISATEEMLAEGLAGAAQSVNDQYFVDDDRSVDWLKVSEDAFTGAIIGGIGGGFLGGGAYTLGSALSSNPAEKASAKTDEQLVKLNKTLSEIQKERSEATTDQQKKQLDAVIAEHEAAKAELMSRKNERYRVMRRRNPKALQELNRLSNQIEAKRRQYESLESETAKKVAKESIDSLIKKFNTLDAAALAEDSKLTLTERLEDAMDDINIAIRESEADLEAVADMEFTSDADLLAVRGVMDRVSSLKNLKKQLMKASGEVDAAMRSGDAAAIAKAEANLDELLGDTLPSEAAPYTTIEQAEDDLGQDSSSETTTEQEQPTSGYEAFTFTSDSQVGEEFAEEVRGTEVNFGMRGVINNLLSSFSNLGLSVVWHKTNESFESARGGESASQSQAFYDKRNKQIHIRPNANAAQIRHEFAHGAFRSLFDNKQTRQRLIKEIEALIQNDPDAQRLYNEVAKAYEGRGEATVEEEIIVKFLEQLTRPDIYEKLNRKGFVQKVIDVINKLFGSKFGVKDSMLITDASEFREVVNALKFAVDTGNSVDVQGVANETSSGFMDMKSRAYPDLVNKTVYFAVHKPTHSGVSRPSYREVNVNDYFHWRNFWASMTGNGRKDWIKDAYYIGDDGKQKRIKTPTPKKDRRTGEVLEMPAKLKSSHQWKMEQAERERKAATEQRRREAFAFTSMYETAREGIDVNELDDEAFTVVEDRLAINDSFKLDDIKGIKPLMKTPKGFKISTDVRANFKVGKLSDYIGISSANAPYDPSIVTSESVKRLSGIGNVYNPKDKSRYVVFAVAEEGLDQDMHDAMTATRNRGEDKFFITHSAMSDDALIANPTVFVQYFVDIKNSIESIREKYSGEGFGEEFNVIPDEISRGLMELVNDFISKKNLSRKKRRRISSIMQDFDSYDSITNTISDPKDVFPFIGSMTDALTFEERRQLINKFKGKGNIESKVASAYSNKDPLKNVSVEVEKALKEEVSNIFPDIEKHKEPSFKNVPTDAIVAAKLITINSKSDIRLEEIPESPFRYAITVPRENVELITFDELYSFYDAYASYELKDGRKISDIIKELEDQGISKKRRDSLVGTRTKLNVSPTYLAQGIFSTDRTASDEKTDSLVDVSELEVDSFNPREQSAFDSIMTRLKVKFQDRFARVMMLQEDIERFRGKSVSESQDFKMSEELMHGKTKDDLDKLQVRVEAIAEDMKTGEFSSDDVSQYIYAKHAKERNKVIFERTEGKVENGSGMSDAEADQILNSYEGKKKEQMEAISKKVQEIVADTRRTYVELGLESQEAIDAFESMFENYVPLSGIAIDEETAETSSYPTGGGGLAIYGSPTKRARGRKTQAQNILAQVVAQNAQAKVRGRKNEALNTLYNLVQDNPNPKVWRITDTVKYESDNAVGIRVNGQQRYIVFRDASMAKSLKNMGVEKLDFFSKLLRTPAVWLRRSFTTANPEFVISNFARDIQSSVFNALAEAEIEGGMIQGKEVAVKIISRTKQTLPALVKSSFGKSLDAETQRYLDEFREDGGQTGWGYVKPVSEIAAEIESMTDETSKLNKAAQWMSKNSIEVVENVNDAFENSIRLSAYIEARQAGASRAKAAQLAKNITVNFNKHGELGPVFNAWYLFFNASVQGTARLGRSLINLKPKYEPFVGKRTGVQRMTSAQKLAFGLTTLSSMMAMINIGLSDEDEDGELFYNKIPDYEKERNLIMMYDGKHYIKIPLPYGFNLFANVGTAIAETSTGNREAVDAMSFIAMSAFSSFSPISFGQSKDMFTYIGKAFVPTVLKPIAEIAINETYFGGSVYREQFPVGAPKPEYQMAFKSPKAVQDFFEWMNDATGGNEFESGWIDSNPDKFWHIFDYALGGAGQFVTRTADFLHGMGAMVVEGEKMKMDANDIPFLRKLYGDPSKYYDYQLYSDRKEEIQQLYRAVKSGDVDRKLDKYKAVVSLDKRIKTVEKKLKKLRQDRKKAKELPYLQRQNALAEIFEKERSLVMDFNKYYDERRK